MSRTFDTLLDDLAGEITRRDPRFVDLFPPRLPTTAGIEKILGSLDIAPADCERVADLVERGIATFEERGLAGPIRGVPDVLGAHIANGLIDCALAGEGLSALAPATRDARPLEDVLRDDYTASRTPSGARYWIRRSTAPKLLVINALGIPLEFWRALITDSSSGVAPILTETRCGDIHSGGMASDAPLDVHADDLMAVLDSSCTGPIDVLAWCNGGRVGIDLAQRRPDLVRSLTLLSPTLRNGEGPGGEYEEMLAKVFATVESNPTFAASMTRMLGQFFKARDWDRPDTAPEKLAHMFLGLPDAGLARGLLAPMATADTLLNYAGRTRSDEAYRMDDAVARLAVPIMLVTGDCDSIVDNAHTQRIMSKARDLRSFEVKGSGHYIQQLQYPYLRAVLTAFLAERAAPVVSGVTRVLGGPATILPVVPEWWYRSRAPGRRGARLPLSALFTWPAAAKPLAPAIADSERRLTFGQLECGALSLAVRLRALGVLPGDNVLVLSEKRACMAVVAGGIWKTPAVYVPVDVNNPVTRLANIVAQVNPAVIIGATARLEALSDLIGACPTIAFNQVLSGCDEPTDAVAVEPVKVAEESPAYIIFTSGSTGSPKGVMISHASLLDYFYNHNQVLRFGPEAKVFSLAPFHFDISIEDTLLPLSVGAFVYQYNGLAIGQLMRRVMSREAISHLIAVSTLLARITDDGAEVTSEMFPELTMVMTGAEECDPQLVELWLDRMPRTRVINAYGPTEATIVCLTHTIVRRDRKRETAYPIGLPLPGVTAMIVDVSGCRITTPGVAGELLIGGRQVMMGYLGLPAQTARACPEVDGARRYRTGDLCYLDDEGRYVFAGRIDDMIKIAGRRIHLGEIRHAAMAAGLVQRAIVGVCEWAGSVKICLVAVARLERLWVAADAEELRRNLAAALPDYMIPTFLGLTTESVVTGNGKSDDSAILGQLTTAALRHGNRINFQLLHGKGFEPF